MSEYWRKDDVGRFCWFLGEEKITGDLRRKGEWVWDFMGNVLVF